MPKPQDKEQQSKAPGRLSPTAAALGARAAVLIGKAFALREQIELLRKDKDEHGYGSDPRGGAQPEQPKGPHDLSTIASENTPRLEERELRR